jgi:hypothetical protein
MYLEIFITFVSNLVFHLRLSSFSLVNQMHGSKMVTCMGDGAHSSAWSVGHAVPQYHWLTDFMAPEHKGSSLQSWELTSSPYAEPGESTQHSPSQFP